MRFYVPVGAVLNTANAPSHLSCDWLKAPWPRGILIFPLEIYRKMEALQHG